MVLEIGISLIIFAVVVSVASRMVRRRSERIDAAARFRSDFLDSAHALIRDERVPDSVANFARWMAEHLYNSTLLWRICWALFTSPRPQPTELGRRIAQLPPELQTLFVKTVVLWGVSLTYNNLVLGFIFRRLFWVLTNGGPPKTTLSDSRIKVLTDDFGAEACAA